MNDHILTFIKKQHVANVCCINEDGTPYCFSCFYAINSKKGLLYFKTSPSSNHAVMMLKNAEIAGTILPDELNMLAVKGLQFTGRLVPLNDPLTKDSSVSYYKKYPFALAMSGEIWTIQFTSMKMTDNKNKGLGEKLSWKLEELKSV